MDAERANPPVSAGSRKRRKKETSKQRQERRNRFDLRLCNRLLALASQGSRHHNAPPLLAHVIRAFVAKGDAATHVAPAAQVDASFGGGSSSQQQPTEEIGPLSEEILLPGATEKGLHGPLAATGEDANNDNEDGGHEQVVTKDKFTSADLSAKQVDELRAMCRQLNLPVPGR